MMTEDGNIQLDHTLNIKVPKLSSPIEKALGRALKSFDRACHDFSRSITIVGYGFAAYLIMSGVSKIMEARNNTKSLCDDNDDDNKQHKRNKKKNKKKDKGDGESGDCKEEEETEVKDRDLAPPDRTAYYAKYSPQIHDDGPNVRDNTPSYANIYNIPP